MAILTLVLGLFKASFVYNDTMFITGFTSPIRVEIKGLCTHRQSDNRTTRVRRGHMHT